MRLSGFTFIRNALKYDFPIVEVISSALPIVDEFIVNVGQSDDGTLDLIRSIPSTKIRIVESVWDDSLCRDGQVFGMQQNTALLQCTGDWALLLQGDEVLHEKDHPAIQQALHHYDPQPNVLGLVLRMLHFKGDFWSIDPWMYHKATRIIRNHCGVQSSTDGCDFESPDKRQMIKSGPHGRLIKARIFHYGWVRDSYVLREKLRFQYRRHDGERLSEDTMDLQAALRAEFQNYDVLKDFRGTHPVFMEKRIQSASRFRPRRNRWLNPRFYKEIMSHGFRG